MQWRRQNFSAVGAQPGTRISSGHLQKIIRPFLISSRQSLLQSSYTVAKIVFCEKMVVHNIVETVLEKYLL